MQALDGVEICLEKVRLESKMKPRLQAESVWVIWDYKKERKKGWTFRYLLRKTNEHKLYFRWVER